MRKIFIWFMGFLLGPLFILKLEAHIFAPYHSQCECSNFFAEVDFLYWNSTLDGLEFAFHATNAQTPGIIQNNSQIDDLDFGWDPGIRAGIGYSGCCWNFALIGTYLPAESTGSELAPTADLNAGGLHPSWFPAIMGFAVGEALADWKLDFATVDLIGSCVFYPCCCFALIPNFGLRATYIKQRYHVDYNDVVYLIVNNVILTTDNTNLTFHDRYRAIGFKAGSDFWVPLFDNVSLTGGVGGSIVFGKINLKEFFNGASVGPDEAPVLGLISNVFRDQKYRLRANLEAELGLTYSTCICSCPFALSANYFFSVWFDQNDFKNSFFTAGIFGADTALSVNSSILDRHYGNLQMQGLILRAELLF